MNKGEHAHMHAHYFLLYGKFLSALFDLIQSNPIPLLYKGIGMLKLGRMHRQTGEKFVDPTAMSRQMREVSDF